MSALKCPAGLSSDCVDDDLPICTDRKPDGSRYSHLETCATYRWLDDACAPCQAVLAQEVDL